MVDYMNLTAGEVQVKADTERAMQERIDEAERERDDLRDAIAAQDPSPAWVKDLQERGIEFHELSDETDDLSTITERRIMLCREPGDASVGLDAQEWWATTDTKYADLKQQQNELLKACIPLRDQRIGSIGGGQQSHIFYYCEYCRAHTEQGEVEHNATCPAPAFLAAIAAAETEAAQEANDA